MTGQQTAARYAPIEVTIEGRRYTLRFQWGRLRALRDLTDGRLDILTHGITKVGVDDLPLLVWAGITHGREGGDPSLEPEQVHAMVEEMDIREVNALDRAVLDALGVDIEALMAAADEIRKAAGGEAATADPLKSEATSPIRTSPSGESPSASSTSASTTSGP